MSPHFTVFPGGRYIAAPSSSDHLVPQVALSLCDVTRTLVEGRRQLANISTVRGLLAAASKGIIYKVGGQATK